MRTSTMRVRVLLFGRLKESAAAESWREVDEGACAGDVLAALAHEGVVAEDLLRACAVALNQEYVAASTLLRDGDELAVLPPVSGGRA